MAAIRRFEELECWQLAREIARGVYRATRTQPVSGDFALSNQMRRAAVSITSNIAEGFERGTRKQQIEFCYIAKGSLGELRSQVIIARDVSLLGEDAFQWLTERCEQCSRVIYGYIRSLRASSERFPGPKFAEPRENETCTEASTIERDASA